MELRAAEAQAEVKEVALPVSLPPRSQGLGTSHRGNPAAHGRFRGRKISSGAGPIAGPAWLPFRHGLEDQGQGSARVLLDE